MNEYIFYTTEGHTIAPNEDVEVNNCQVLGIAKGKDKEDATDNEIDTRVFDLYGLTEEERKVVLEMTNDGMSKSR